jgi:hypothetical protein
MCHPVFTNDVSWLFLTLKSPANVKRSGTLDGALTGWRHGEVKEGH